MTEQLDDALKPFQPKAEDSMKSITDKYDIQFIPVEEIYSDDSFNCRGVIAPNTCIDLANSIKERGLDQPIIIQPFDKVPGKKYRIVAGHRRFVALRILNLEVAPCYIRLGLDETTARTQNLVENLHRQDLNIKQEALAIKWYFQHGFSVKDIAMYLGMSTTWVDARKLLLDLPEDIQDVAAAGLMTQEQIRAASKLKSKDDLYEFVRQIKDRHAKGEKFKIVSKVVDKKQTFVARERKKGEIEQVIELCMDVWEEGNLATRALAWAAGNIDTITLFNEIQKAAVEDGLSFRIPSELMDGMFAKIS